MTKNNLMNASRRTALKVAGASAALVAGGVSAAEAATRSGGKRARVTPVTQRPGGPMVPLVARSSPTWITVVILELIHADGR